MAREARANNASSPTVAREPNIVRRYAPGALAAAMLILAAMLVYIPAMRAGYIWDDVNYIRRDPYLPTARIIQADDGLRRIWLTAETADYFPLTHTVFWIQWRCWGTDAAGYHVVNVLLHAAAAVLLWGVLKELKLPGAWLAGLIFAVHPVCVASVGWISELKNTLSMVFYLAAILGYLRFDRGCGRKWYALSLVWFAAALLSKTSVVMLPVVLLALAWWRRAGVSVKDLRRIAPLLGMSLVMGLVTIWFQQRHAIGIGQVVRTEGLLDRLAAAGWVVWFYLYKAVLPVKLSMVYPRWSVDAGAAGSWVPLIALLAAFGVLWRFGRTWARAPLFALGYFVVTLFPVLGFFDMSFMRYSFVADHFQYVSILAVIALAAGGAWRICRHRRPAVRWASRAAVAVVVAVLGVGAWRQAGVYQNRRTLWEDTLAKNRDAWVAHYNLGLVHADAGETAQAANSYLAAIALKPDYGEAHNNLGAVYMTTGDLGSAARHYRTAARLMPDHPNPHFNLGNIFAKAGHPNDAVAHYLAAIDADPNHIDAHFNLGVVYGKGGDANDAAAQYRIAIRLAPDHARAHNNLGLIHAGRGRLDEAIGHYLSAIRAASDYALAHNNLARAYERKGRVDAAIRHYRTALRIRRDYPAARERLDRLTGERPIAETLPSAPGP